MFLSDMKIKDIDFGETEGKKEFSNSEKISNMFFKDIFVDELEKFIDGRLRYIYGLKGTGKTSMLKYLENKANSDSIQTMYISYKEIKEEADIIHEFREELSSSKDKDTYTLTFWRWYLLSLISKSFLNASRYDPSNLIYNSKVGFFRAIANLLDIIADVSLGNEENNFCINFGNKQVDLKWDKQTADRIRQLEKNIKEKLDKKIIIFIDELEISKLLSTYDVDAVLVKNLIRATRKINDLNDNLHIVLAVRSEVVGSIAVAGDEINKELEDYGYEIEWHRRKFDIHHPLLSMYIQKIRYSMKKYIQRNCQNNLALVKELDKMTNTTIWYRWFPRYFGSIETPEFMLQNTWLRPRDLIRLFRTMSKYSKSENNIFTQYLYQEAIKKVGEDSWQEIKEELSSKYTENTIQSIQSILEKMQIIFNKNRFQEEALKYGLNFEDVNKILLDLYRVSVIGNSYIAYNQSRFSTTYRFEYRNDKSLYEDRAIYVHRVIQHALGLTEFDRSLLFEHLSESDKNKYISIGKEKSIKIENQKKIDYIVDDELLDVNSDSQVMNIKDMLRDSDFRYKE